MRFLRPLIFASTLLIVTLSSIQVSQAQSPPVDDRVVTISTPGESAVDPEILPGGHLLTYQADSGVYLARLDPATGLFVNPGGKDILVDTGAARPLETFNGPEFGIDMDGWALYYAKEHQGDLQIWRAALTSSGVPAAEPLSSGERHQTQLVSRNPTGPTTRIAAIQGTWQRGTAVWFDESNPAAIYPISPVENGIASLRWVDNSYMLTYSQRVGPDRGQVVLLDTSTNAEQTITGDRGDKTDPYGWFAPDYDDDLLVLAILDDAAVAIYRDTGGSTWERIATLEPPAESRFDFVSSAEPFVVNGRSYISLVVKNAEDSRELFSDSEVWLFDLNPDPTARYTERCDSGEPGVARTDPETYIGEDNVYVYYNVISGPGATPYEMRRCRSALTSDGAPAPMPAVTPAPPDDSASTDACQWIEPAETDTRIDEALAPHYVCHEPATTPRDHLLVFFPGTGATPSDYTQFVAEGASMGLHSIGLSYVNPRSVNLQICPRDPDPNCHENVRSEVIYGGDRHPAVTISEANTVINRLVQLLRSLDAAQPEAGWGQYLDGDSPRWDRIVVAGHSQGAGMAGFIAHEQAVARAVLFAWVDLVRGVAAPWVLDDHATPAERVYAFEHVDDRQRGESAKQQMFQAYGIDASGEVNVDDAQPPYNNAQVLLTAADPAQTGERPSAAAHNMVVADEFTPIENGVPVLRDVWRYLLDIGQ
ncbi:MAG: BPSS1187 family protein [Chloroflexota bacterium]